MHILSKRPACRPDRLYDLKRGNGVLHVNFYIICSLPLPVKKKSPLDKLVLEILSRLWYHTCGNGGVLFLNYVFQFCRLLGFCFLGEVCARLLPLPIPSSIYGLLLLLAALKLGLVRLKQVREAAIFLTGIFPVLFVPAAAGVMDLKNELLSILLPALIAVLPVTVLVMAVSGRVTQRIARGKGDKTHA